MGTVVQTAVAILLYRLSRELHNLETANALKEDPVFRLHFNGLQSQPKDPKKEMLHFMFTVVNEGRRGGTIGDWSLEFDENGTSRRAPGFAFAPAEEFESPIDGLPRSFAEEIMGKKPRQKASPDHFIAAGDARRYVGYLPANAGYEKWTRVKLRIDPIGGQAGEVEFDWDLFWLKR